MIFVDRPLRAHVDRAAHRGVWRRQGVQPFLVGKALLSWAFSKRRQDFREQQEEAAPYNDSLIALRSSRIVLPHHLRSRQSEPGRRHADGHGRLSASGESLRVARASLKFSRHFGRSPNSRCVARLEKAAFLPRTVLSSSLIWEAPCDAFHHGRCLSPARDVRAAAVSERTSTGYPSSACSCRRSRRVLRASTRSRSIPATACSWLAQMAWYSAGTRGSARLLAPPSRLMRPTLRALWSTTASNWMALCSARLDGTGERRRQRA